ncbi:MAG: 1-deoxy-D-xylulose-5-phosphate synthase [candidate division WS1 bacterium]|jgi:1-deoxy-D-xylulose-5-phosphate synthase|nr:1-deoxy-D-xylulose-5-phosphate synthase [candidate division WS1 bacterium]
MSHLLDDINSPADLRKLTVAQLEKLAQEIRDRILEVTAAHGGHLAPSLGVVELTIALHHTFHAPEDKILWDVGHQTYAHKLLTGRREAFPTIRQTGGLSGFTRRDESEYDPFGAGHGSTSLSAALGFATARDLRGGQEHVVAVIGDGALTGGLALAALNQAGHLKHDMLVVLNDNEMSIGRNVGALSAYLASLRTAVEPHVRRAREETARFLSAWPLGDSVLEALDRLKDGLKHLLVPGMLFEELGFTYLGPLDGHSLPQLLETLESSHKLPGPLLLHVLTQKGKGYRPAEVDPRRFHGTSPFTLSNGEPEAAGAATFSALFGKFLCELAEKDQRIVAVSAAMLDGTGLAEFKRRFPDRCFDVGMAEEHAVTFAAGLAAAGLRPVVAIYSTFLQRGYDQIVHDVALQNLPVVFCLDRAGLVGDDGPTHHGVFDLSYLSHIPGLVLMAPSSGGDLRGMLQLALSLDSPCALRYPRGAATPAVPAAVSSLPAEDGGSGSGEKACTSRLIREGSDAALLAVGTRVQPALAAAAELEQEGLHCAVVDVRFVRPLDEVLLLRLAQETGLLITVEEAALAGGYGTAVATFLADRDLHDCRLVRLGLPDRFIEQGQREELLAQAGLEAAGIAEAVRRART